MNTSNSAPSRATSTEAAPGTPARLDLDLTQQEPIPPAGVQAAMSLLQSGKLHRYGETGGKPSEVSALEAEFAKELGVRYCVAMNSCGSTLFAALRSAGVQPNEPVLSNCFTLAPVPGAIEHVGARAVLVDVTSDLTIDLDDLELKARTSGARVLLLSHMRGHICDMERLAGICKRLDVELIEDCAHTMGAAWAGRPTGTWGRAGCFSLQSYKHANSGEGGLLATNDEDLAARAILLSGSYMLYGSHLARPGDEVFERWKYITPNFSLRMSNLAAAVARPQLGEVLADRCRRWNERYAWVEAGLAGIAGLSLPQRPADEQFVASSIQFLLDMPAVRIQQVIADCAARGVHIKWFGAQDPAGFTSVWSHWRYLATQQPLPSAGRVLAGLCDMRLPLTLTKADCTAIAGVIREAIDPSGLPPSPPRTTP